MSGFKGILGRTTASQVAEFEQEPYAYSQNNREMGTSAVDAMQVVDKKYAELLSVFDLDKLREVLTAYNLTENPGASVLQAAMSDKSPNRDLKTMNAFIYVWEHSFLALYDRGALDRCFADDLDPDNLPQAVHDQLNRMVASVAEYEGQQLKAARANAAPKLSQNDLVAMRKFVQGDPADGKQPASIAAIRKRIESLDLPFTAFVEKELGISVALINFVMRYEVTPSARLRPINNKITIGNDVTGMVEITKNELDKFMDLAEKVRLI